AHPVELLALGQLLLDPLLDVLRDVGVVDVDLVGLDVLVGLLQPLDRAAPLARAVVLVVIVVPARTPARRAVIVLVVIAIPAGRLARGAVLVIFIPAGGLLDGAIVLVIVAARGGLLGRGGRRVAGGGLDDGLAAGALEGLAGHRVGDLERLVAFRA